MKLTLRQESLVTRYLRDVAIQLDQDLPEYEREQRLAQVQKRIERDLSALRKEELDDADVEAALSRLGPASRQAANLSPRRDPRRILMPARDDLIWLGVCAGIALRMELSPWVVRGFFVLGGLFTGPLAVLTYIGLYLYMRRNLGKTPPLDKLKILGRALAVCFIAVLLHVGTGYIFDLIAFIHREYLRRDMPPVGEWGWLLRSRDEYFFYALVTSVPFAVLSGLPLAGGWDYTLKRLSQAFLALYGIVLSFGIASFVVGLILDFVQQFAE